MFSLPAQNEEKGKYRALKSFRNDTFVPSTRVTKILGKDSIRYKGPKTWNIVREYMEQDLTVTPLTDTISRLKLV